MIHLASYFDLPNDAELTRRMELRPKPLTDLAKLGVQEGCKLVELALKQTYIPGAQDLALARAIIGMGKAHIATRYSDEQAYRDTCYCYDVRPETPWFATALTGLGGVGKTQLVRAIQRAITAGVAERISLDGLPSYPVELVWLLTMTLGASLEAILSPLAPDLTKGKGILIAVAKRAYSNGVGLVILDESQFITSTQEAHAKASAAVMKSTYIGPPLLYCANFTMINKLMKRPQQERDRLLSNVHVLMPKPCGSKDYERVIAGQLEIFGSAIASDSAVTASKYAEKIHRYVFGIDRKSAILLEIAWEQSRTEGSEILKFHHVEKAYASRRFASHRDEVNLLMKQAFENRASRDDLWCEFAPPIPTNVVSVPSFGEEKEKQVSAAMSRATLTKEEQEAYDYLSARPEGAQDKKAKVLKHPKADKSLGALQEAGAALLDGHN